MSNEEEEEETALYPVVVNERLAEVARNPKTSSSLLLSSPELSDTKVYESQIRALLRTASHFCEGVVLTSSSSACLGLTDCFHTENMDMRRTPQN